MRRLLLVAGLGGAVLLAFAAATFGSTTVVEYASGLSAGATPNVIAPGPDGAMWFSEYDPGRIGRIAADGTITEFPSSGPGLMSGAHPSGVVAGPDGDVWLTEYGTGELGDINPTTGKLVGEYPLPAGASSEPEAIVVGADGALWFTERGADQIGRIDPGSASPGTSDGITEYEIPSSSHIPSQPVDLVKGPDGALWVTLLDGSVARVDPASVSEGTTDGITRYPLPSANSEPEGIAVGPGNELWVAEYGDGKLAQVDPTSVEDGTSDGITEYPVGGDPLWLSSAADGALWVTDNTDHELIRFDPMTHATTLFGSAQGVSGDATSDAADASGNLWFTEFVTDKIGEVVLAPGVKPPPLMATSPPVVYHGASVATGAVDGDVLTCHPGVYNASPVTHVYHWVWTERTRIATGKRTGGREVTSSTVLGAGSTITLPDLPAFSTSRAAVESSTIACNDMANDGGPTVSETSAPVPVTPLKPVVATKQIRRPRKPSVTIKLHPTITVGVGAGGRNVCEPGTWLHFPTSYTYTWWLGKIGVKKDLRHNGQTVRLTTDDEGKRLSCSVVARNDGGATRGLSNNYPVPATSPKETGPPIVTLATDNPHMDQIGVTSSTHAQPSGSSPNEYSYYTAIAERIYMSCNHGSWSRNDLTFTTRWAVSGEGIDISGDRKGNDYISIGDPTPLQETIMGDQLRFNFTPGNAQEPTLFNGTVTCTVTAMTPQHKTADASSLTLKIWNGCDISNASNNSDYIGVDGPLCGDYESYYAPSSCFIVCLARDSASDSERTRLSRIRSARTASRHAPAPRSG